MSHIDWQWCQSCYGQTLHKSGECVQCHPPKYYIFANQIKHITYITTAKADLQVASAFVIYQN